jgi:hypothetical protein
MLIQGLNDPIEPFILEGAPDGSLVAGLVRERRSSQDSTSLPYRLVLLDAKTLKEQASLAEVSADDLRNDFGKLDVSRDGKLLASASSGEKLIKFWEVPAVIKPASGAGATPDPGAPQIIRLKR